MPACFSTRLYLAALCLFCPVLATAAPVLLATGTAYPPFADEAEPGGGLTVQIVKAVFARMGEASQIEVLPWKRGYAATLAGKYQATFPYIRTAEREKVFLYSAPIIQSQSYLFTLPGRQFDLHRPTTLKKQALCVPNGWAAVGQDKVDAAVAMGTLRLERPNDIHSCIRMVSAGRADGIVLMDLLARTLFAINGMEHRFERSAIPVGATELALIAPRDAPGSAALLTRFNEALMAMKADGSYQRLLPDAPPAKKTKSR
ncbi:ABC transporter substrate-binding protein [Chitinimonas sp. BJYL2]|uniref:substrate-binding periplasmic protein n=1 Tax=Chitinimonas sp. BJYL2 TaxID=2976696 RepID=UPI0022B46EBD|nr:transporter substrate-binding domain-containing protein [Chitinimonas sp. BJYL2]